MSVRDNGAGIPSDKIDSIFDMFMQVDRNSDRSQDGLGIGLTLVKRLVEMHGGSIEAHSAGEGQGSEFVVQLPIIDKPAVASSFVSDVAPGSPSQRRILIVDDNLDSADSLAMLLEITAIKRISRTTASKPLSQSKNIVPKSCCSTSASRSSTATKSVVASANNPGAKISV